MKKMLEAKYVTTIRSDYAIKVDKGIRDLGFKPQMKVEVTLKEINDHDTKNKD